MLKELRCNKLIKEKLEFKDSLNTLIGANDGTNSIGKSSVLMLIDFAFSGDDFIDICSDVIDNVGILTVEMDFIFEGVKYSFSRNTNDYKVVQFISGKETVEKTIDEYRYFLKKHYCFPEDSTSFRGAVNPFTRVWGKDNYNPNRPLNSFPNEPYLKIKPNILKLFSFYGDVKNLEKEKTLTEGKKKILKGAFNEGYIKSLTKPEKKKCEKRLLEVEADIESIKGSIETYAISSQQIVNDENLKLKSKKDALLSSLRLIKNRLKRIEDNLSYGSSVNKKNFEKLKTYFPNVDDSKLAKVDLFHSGVTKILKAELREEKEILEERITVLEADIALIDIELTKSLGIVDKPLGLVDKLLELSIEDKELRDQLRFRDVKDVVDSQATKLSKLITEKVSDSLKSIEVTLNLTMSEYIGRYYTDNPVHPEINLFETNYNFSHANDSGTGKAYANMVAMDMSFLEKTYLPILIHDLIVFSNIEDHATEEIIKVYCSAKKQSFIALDKVKRFNITTQKIINERKFISLDSKNLAFKESWKKIK